MAGVQWVGLSAASYPAPLEVWRVTVARANEISRLGLELLTLTMWDTSVRRIALDWTLRIHTTRMGTIYAEPAISEESGRFIVDMRFDSATPLVPASVMVATWEDMIPNTRVLKVERLNSLGESVGPSAEELKGGELAAAEASGGGLGGLAAGLGELGDVVKVVAVAAAVLGVAFIVSRFK